MKNLKEYLNEGLLSRKISTKTPIRYRPETNKELQDIIIELLKKGQTNLNCIDVGKIEDLSSLFCDVNREVSVGDIDISEWNVSNVKYMIGMFYDCELFNSDLSKWDVSNVKFMASMFYNCNEFNSDLSKWNVSKVKNKERMFDNCDTLIKNNKIPDWYKG